MEKVIEKDLEAVMAKELSKKKQLATKEMEVSRDEFTKWYRENVLPKRKQRTGVIPWSEPAISWMFAAWVAGESSRVWMTEEDKNKAAAQKELFSKRQALTKARKKLRAAL